MKKIGLLAILILASALLPTGCVKKATPQDEYTVRGYRPWVGPGWYYGIYFSNNGEYNNWRRKHYHRYRNYGPPKETYKHGQMSRRHRRNRR